MADAFACGLDGSFGGFAQECFELGKDLLDGIEIWRVRRQEEELGAGQAEGSANGFAFVAAKIIHDDDIAGLQCWQEYLLDISQETGAIDRSIDDARGIDAIGAQCCQEGQRPPSSERDFGDEALAARASSMNTRHVGLGPGLINKDQAFRIELSLMRPPALTPPFYVGAILLGCVQAFFLNVIPSCWRKCQSA